MAETEQDAESVTGAAARPGGVVHLLRASPALVHLSPLAGAFPLHALNDTPKTLDHSVRSRYRLVRPRHETGQCGLQPDDPIIDSTNVVTDDLFD